MSETFKIDDRPVTVSIIAAVAENRVIGRDNALLWHIPEDFKYFKQTTMGKPMIMGRKTFESLPGMLPGRAHIVISRSEEPIKPPPSKTEGAAPELHQVKTIEDAVKKAYHIARNNNENEIFIIGGAQIYKLALNDSHVDRLYITRVHQPYVGDAYFPVIDKKQWKVVSAQHNSGDPDFTFEVLERV